MSEKTTAHPAVVVALGASNTAGYGVGVEKAYPALLERLLAERGIPAVVRNAGISGNTTSEMLARLDDAVSPETRLVLFQPGSNDTRLGIPATVREANIQSITGRLNARGIRVIRVAAAFEAARYGNLQSDGIHYTEHGHAVIARHLIDEVASALSE